MRYEAMTMAAVEPCFEPPPRLLGRSERRLTMHAADDAETHAYRDNAVTLSFADPHSPVIVAVGSAVRDGFGLTPGTLDETRAGPWGDLGERLREACDALHATADVVAFETAVATPGAACVLLRGVLLPTRGGAEAVLSWKEVLDHDATTRLRAELRAAFVAPRRAPVDAFARC